MKRLKANEKLPMELEEEILSRLPPLSLTRFRTVDKQWNSLINDKRFIDNHLARARASARAQFILTTKSKLCSVSVNLGDAVKIEVCDLTIDIPGLESQMMPRKLHHCDGLLLLSSWNHGSHVWNPCLRQSRWIEPDLEQTTMSSAGIGYDNQNCGYEIFASQYIHNHKQKHVWKFFNFASNAWIEYSYNGGSSSGSTKRGYFKKSSADSVSLNGNLYWVASCIGEKLFILRMDFSKKRFEIFCNLPCKTTHLLDSQVLAVFRGDRFSVLEQCKETNKIEIWVTKNKITWDGTDVEWIKFMEISCPNLPDLVQSELYSLPSYFIEDQTLVVCSYDKTGQAWIYVVRGNKLSTIRIDYVVDMWPSHCTYFPSLVPVSLGQ